MLLKGAVRYTTVFGMVRGPVWDDCKQLELLWRLNAVVGSVRGFSLLMSLVLVVLVRARGATLAMKIVDFDGRIGSHDG